MARWVLEISFDGTNYHGWQKQANANSVQETLEKALSTMLQKETTVMGCGRTDTGVHATQFFMHFDAIQPLNEFKHIHKLNAILPKDIAIKNLIKVEDDFHARFDATSRTYEYHIHFTKDPFLLNRSYHFVANQLNVEAMNIASTFLLEFEDFTSFSKSKTQVFTNNCDVKFAEWTKEGHKLKFTISANRFLRNMVRAIVGTLIEVGSDKITLENFRQIIEAKDRKQAGYSVPACGLYLTKVVYPNLKQHE